MSSAYMLMGKYGGREVEAELWDCWEVSDRAMSPGKGRGAGHAAICQQGGGVRCYSCIIIALPELAYTLALHLQPSCPLSHLLQNV